MFHFQSTLLQSVICNQRCNQMLQYDWIWLNMLHAWHFIICDIDLHICVCFGSSQKQLPSSRHQCGWRNTFDCDVTLQVDYGIPRNPAKRRARKKLIVFSESAIKKTYTAKLSLTTKTFHFLIKFVFAEHGAGFFNRRDGYQET